MNVPSLYLLPVFSQATSAVNGYPNGIGPVSRVLGTNDWVDDYGLGGIFKGAGDAAKKVAEDFVKSQVVRGVIAGKKALGYTDLGPFMVNGKPYTKMLNPQKVPVLVDDMGRETPVTPQTQAAEQKIDSSGNIITGTAIGLGVVAAVVALYFILRRK